MKYLGKVLVILVVLAVSACGGSSGGGSDTSKTAQAQAMMIGIGTAIHSATATAFANFVDPTPPDTSTGGLFGPYKANSDCPPDYPVGCIYVMDITETSFGDGTGTVSGTSRLVLAVSTLTTQDWDVIASGEEGIMSVFLSAYPFTATVAGTTYTGTISSPIGGTLSCPGGGVAKISYPEASVFLDNGSDITITCSGVLDLALNDGTTGSITLAGELVMGNVGIVMDTNGHITGMIPTTWEIVGTNVPVVIDGTTYTCSGTGGADGSSAITCTP